METIITIINFVILGLIISLPILTIIRLRKSNTRKVAVKYFLIGLLLMAFLISIFAAWGDFSNLILLYHYGYSVDGMNYENVLPENRERVDTLVTSLMGIGWSLKAMFGFIMTIPYLIFVYFGKMLTDRIMIKKNEA